MTTYQIETDAGRGWTTEGLAAHGGNEFGTREEAERAIEELRQLGDDWARAQYRVKEVA